MMVRRGLPMLVLLGAATAWAQGPVAPGQPVSRVPVPGSGTPTGPAPIVTPTVDPKVKSHLDGWEAVLKASQNFYSECSVVRKHLLHKTEKPSKGSVMCLKPNLAFMRLDEVLPPGTPKNPNAYEAYICSGKAIFEYDAAAKVVNEYPMPANGASGNLLLDFLSGAITANGALQRFDIRLAKEESHYVHLELRPLLPADKQDFEVMTVVLFAPTVPKLAYLPRVVLIRKRNGQEEELWQFPEPKVNVQMDPKSFEPQFPQGWKHVKQQPKPATGPGTGPAPVPPPGNPPLGPPK